MASRVSVTVNVRDNSRAGITQVRNAIRRMNSDIRRAGGRAEFNVRINARSQRQAQATIRRLQRQLGGNINLRPDVRLSPGQARRINQRLGGQIRIRADVDPPNRNRFRRTITRTLTSPARTTGAIVGGILSDGIGQGIVGGFRTAGPVGMAVFAAIIAGSLSVIGAALSGLLVTALGGAFVTIGLMSAFKSKEITEQWKHTSASLRESFESIGDPLVPVLDRALERLEEMASKAAPKLEKAFAQTAGATESLMNSLMDGFESFAGEAFQPIMEAWNVFAPVFGEQWDEFMRELGDAFGDMADLVKEHPTEIAMALEVVFEALELLVRTVTFFGEAWVFWMNMSLKATAAVIKITADMAIRFIESLGAISEAASIGLSWIPGIGGKIEKANKAFTIWRDATIAKLEGVKRSADLMAGSLDRANKKRKLEADVRSWRSDLQQARADLRKTTSQKARAKLTADISNLKSKISQANMELARLNGKTATTYIITHSQTYRSVHDIVGKATGGVVGRAASGGVRNNLTMVGEQGPELVDLPVGSRVRSNSDSRRLIGQGGGSGPVATLRLEAGSDDVSRLLMKIIRNSVRAEGGDVQVVLGRG